MLAVCAQLLSWSDGGRWLSAAGGSAVLAIAREFTAGDSPLLVWSGTKPSERAAALAWCEGRSCESLLAVIEAGTGTALVFDVAVSDGATPRRTSPLLAVCMPAARCGGAAPPLRLALVQEREAEAAEEAAAGRAGLARSEAEPEAAPEEDRGAGGVLLVVARQDWLWGTRVPS